MVADHYRSPQSRASPTKVPSPTSTSPETVTPCSIMPPIEVLRSFRTSRFASRISFGCPVSFQQPENFVVGNLTTQIQQFLYGVGDLQLVPSTWSQLLNDRKDGGAEEVDPRQS